MTVLTLASDHRFSANGMGVRPGQSASSNNGHDYFPTETWPKRIPRPHPELWEQKSS
ncbi:hypothetical protein FRACA_2890009 [Frankia canadensis]|uniref:Uncharacterized protein n=1 Tax=Frankia canadensis TaxID=1836972 RepID=A0A2I2KTB4_9ACTN|nr:hypothetical protein FRACA_2890009 [Frankia canadensis]SOU56176.1 hypothetical protein FRACA_2890009 [Frankia canadensis]